MQTTIGPEQIERSKKIENGRSGQSKITLFVRSRKVAIERRIISVPFYTGGVATHTIFQPKPVVVYENVLDQEQEEALESAKSLAHSLGMRLEVKDISKLGLVSRLFDRVFPSKAPFLSFGDKEIGSVMTLVSGRYSSN